MGKMYLERGRAVGGHALCTQGRDEGQPEAGEQLVQHLQAGPQAMIQPLSVHQHRTGHPVHIFWQLQGVTLA